jgi:YD repeat-containing protein
MAQRRTFRLIALTGAACAAAAAVAARANETVTYTYDARGRLVQVSRAGTVNNNVVTAYTHDKADNRTAKATTGSPNPGPP